MIENDVVMPEIVHVVQRPDEPLYESAVDPILLHPFEVPQDCCPVERTKHLGRPAVGMPEVCREPLVGAKLRQVGPEVNFGVARGQSPAVLGPAMVSAASAVALSVKPALVAAENLALHG